MSRGAKKVSRPSAELLAASRAAVDGSDATLSIADVAAKVGKSTFYTASALRVLAADGVIVRASRGNYARLSASSPPPKADRWAQDQKRIGELEILGSGQGVAIVAKVRSARPFRS